MGLYLSYPVLFLDAEQAKPLVGLMLEALRPVVGGIGGRGEQVRMELDLGQRLRGASAARGLESA